MARKDAMQLQLEINSDEEWNDLISKSGLIVVDVYGEWSGPCAAMVNLLRKIKMEIGGDMLVLAIGGGLVNLMFGANAPQLRRLIVTELEIQAAVEAGTARRHPIPWDKLTEEEQRREDIRVEEEQRKQHEKEEAERAAAARRLARIGWALHKCTVLVYLPFTWDANENTLPAHDEISKILEDDMFVRETIKIDLDPVVACMLFYGEVPVKVIPPPEEEVVEGEDGEGGEAAESPSQPQPQPKQKAPAPPPPPPPPPKGKPKSKSVAAPPPPPDVPEEELERCPPPELVEALAEGKTIVHYAEALSPAVEEGQLPPPPEDIVKKVARAVYGCEAPAEGHAQQIDPERYGGSVQACARTEHPSGSPTSLISPAYTAAH
ncbi:protein enabled homolog [Schistocerca nitens]|uniref:protein enabled homolog n=1 Tax=Schistocerca nitens TaxID=7011 RepID=UPI002119763A|nr:protein enabled homolog [Schistocerca nitens]